MTAVHNLTVMDGGSNVGSRWISRKSQTALQQSPLNVITLCSGLTLNFAHAHKHAYTCAINYCFSGPTLDDVLSYEPLDTTISQRG